MTCVPSKDVDQSWLCAWWVAKDSNLLQADSEDSDQTGRMPSWSESLLGTQVILFLFFFMLWLIYDSLSDLVRLEELFWLESVYQRNRFRIHCSVCWACFFSWKSLSHAIYMALIEGDCNYAFGEPSSLYTRQNFRNWKSCRVRMLTLTSALWCVSSIVHLSMFSPRKGAAGLPTEIRTFWKLVV